MQRSEIDPSRIITNEYWAISLVRLPDRSNSEHAFLVLEGKTSTKSMIWFVDFVAREPFGLLCPGIRDGVVRIDYRELAREAGPSNRLLFQCKKTLMNIKRGDRVLFSAWLIPKTAAEKLIQNIEMQERNPPKYNIFGNTALAGSSRSVSGKDPGHNCFTFARTMLCDLNEEYIVIPSNTLPSWILTATLSYPLDKLGYGPWDGVRFTALTILGTLVIGIAAAHLFPKLL